MHRLWAIGTILLLPVFMLYGLWVYVGSLMDKANQRR